MARGMREQPNVQTLRQAAHRAGNAVRRDATRTGRAIGRESPYRTLLRPSKRCSFKDLSVMERVYHFGRQAARTAQTKTGSRDAIPYDLHRLKNAAGNPHGEENAQRRLEP